MCVCVCHKISSSPLQAICYANYPRNRTPDFPMFTVRKLCVNRTQSQTIKQISIPYCCYTMRSTHSQCDQLKTFYPAFISMSQEKKTKCVSPSTISNEQRKSDFYRTDLMTSFGLCDFEIGQLILKNIRV